MDFATRTEATELIKDFVLAQGKRAVQCRKQSGRQRIVYKCTSPTKCSFSAVVARSRSKAGQGFYLSSFRAQHNGCTGLPRPTAKQVSRMASAIACVQSNPSVKGKQLINQVKTLNGVTLSSRMSYRVRDEVNALSRGDYEEGYQMLESMLKSFCGLNPGAYMVFEVDAERRFRRAFLSNPDIVVIQQYTQRILGFDGALVNTRNQENTMLILVGRDGNNENIVLAVSVVPSEDTANCQWFMLNCMKAGIQMSGTPVFMDRGKAGIAAGATLGLPVHFCTRYIAENVRKKFKGRFTPELEKKLYEVQRAETKEEFEDTLGTLGINNKDMETYIRGINPANWALYPHIDSAKLYGWNSINFVESEHESALEALDRNPAGFFMHYMENFMEKKFRRSQQASEWHAGGKVITEYAEEKFAEEQKCAGFHSVSMSSPTKGYAYDMRSTIPIRRFVDISARTCECPFMRQCGIPCRHFASVLATIKQFHTIYDYFDDCYLVKNYLTMYDVENDLNIKLPTHTAITKDTTVLAPVSVVKPGKKRVASAGEAPSNATAKRSNLHKWHC